MKSSARNIWNRRHLLRILVSSNVKRQNKSSVLGYLWWLLDPALLTAVYYLLVAVLFKRTGSPDNQPYIMFLICGLLPWKAFGGSIGQSVSQIRSQAGIVKSISFPKAVLPISAVLSNTIFFIFSLLVVVGLGIAFGIWPGVYYIALPLVIGLQILVTIGFALLVCTVGLFFEDTANIIGHLLRAWFYLSPGLYSVDMVPERFLTLYKLNPFCQLMTSYRDIIMHNRMPAMLDLGYALLAGVVSLLIGYALFRRYEGRFVQKL